MCAIIPEFANYFKIVLKNFNITNTIMIRNCNLHGPILYCAIQVYNTSERHIFYCLPGRSIRIVRMNDMMTLYNGIQFKTRRIDCTIERQNKIVRNNSPVNKPLRVVSESI